MTKRTKTEDGLKARGLDATIYRKLVEPAVEPSRDPNRFHHAAALVEQMDRSELYHLGQLVLERLVLLQKGNTK